jgi:helix-turn-helix protein
VKWHIKGVNVMKKIVNLFLVLVLMTSFVSLAFAAEADDHAQGNLEDENGSHDQVNETGSHQNDSSENETEHDDSFNNETEHEIEIMNNSLGARIRLLQLEKAILTNLLKGTMAVQVLQGLEVNTTQLEAILADLRDVLDAVRAADPAANDSVQIFVQLKNETRNLTKEFRETIRALLDDETIREIKERLRNMTSDELQNCSQKIQKWIRHFNRNQLYRLYGIIGETNTTLLNQYLNGNITLDQVKLQLHKMINQMTKEKRYMIFSEVKEENIKKKIQAHESFDDMEHHGGGNSHGKQD